MGKLTRNRLQNIAICLLSLSAVVLFAQIQLTALGRIQLAADPADAVQGATGSLAEFSSPLRVAVTNSFGRSGQGRSTTSDASSLVLLLGEALGTAGPASAVPEASFRELLDGENLFFDFTLPLPLPVLSALLGAEASPSLASLTARRLILAAEGSSVQLYFEDEAVYSCTTSVLGSALSSVLDSYQSSSASFAFESGEEYSALDPYTLFIDEPSEYHTLSASNPLADTDTLLRRLQFNPHTNNRYVDSGGTEVIIENDRTLRIYTDGTVTYQSGDGERSFPVSAAGESPTAVEAAAAARSLAESVLSPGEASLCLRGVQQKADGWLVSFGYQLDGVPILFSDEMSAAELLIQNGSIVSFTLRLRSYTATDSPSVLLPVRQAAAIARHRYSGAELMVAYVDSLSDSVSAQWVAG
ncbi:hypothetical protein KQI82_12650 [Oscillibacter sp. MSJ-2]|uniref:Regulatory protein YycH domain-containing protein n=1 Tax=Dysosmobacter acutus TaxID=2841504 RepID=A0ABS6FEM8_9FIRM|nr:hypothetical protein [Dysosmobacter acutus]MBU5627759.1 hypothetical protein [Dysosmobacter acutus]